MEGWGRGGGGVGGGVGEGEVRRRGGEEKGRKGRWMRSERGWRVSHHGDPQIVMPFIVVPESSRYVTFGSELILAFNCLESNCFGCLNRFHNVP